MTNLEALKSMIEYDNANLFDKVLTDNSLDASAEYSSASKQGIDMCLADVYLYLATHPQIQEGSYSEAWTPERLMNARTVLYRKYGLTPPEIENAVSGMPTMTGKTESGNEIW